MATGFSSAGLGWMGGMDVSGFESNNLYTTQPKLKFNSPVRTFQNRCLRTFSLTLLCTELYQKREKGIQENVNWVEETMATQAELE